MVAVAILYDAKNKESVTDAQSVLDWIVTKRVSDKLDMHPVLVDVNDLDHAPAYPVAVVAAGVRTHYVNRHFPYGRTIRPNLMAS